jgi:Protein of unknown function (DUF3486)
MPKRSKVEALPQELKVWLDAELVKRGFADYVQLAADLQAKGAELSKSSLHRYGSKFEERMAQLKVSTEQARAVVAAAPDDEGAMNEALIRLTQDKLFQVLVDLEVDPESIALPKLTKSIADLARSSISQKKWQIEVRTKAAERMKAVESEAKALKGETRDVALAMLEKVRAVYEGAM